MIGKTFVAIYKNKIVILHEWLFTVVEFKNGDKCLSCELGPISDFEIIGEL